MEEADTARRYLAVDWSMLKTREKQRSERAPHPLDVLIDGARSPDVFARVLPRWLERNETWRAARVQFQENFRRQVICRSTGLWLTRTRSISYRRTHLRLLRKPDAPLLEARDKAKALFAQLPQSPDRDSLLNVLGRIGKPQLKKKIVARAALISQRLPHLFPDLRLVVEEAVNCRNFFVHASEQKFPYTQNWPTVGFFIDTLEFVFGATDLMDAGWNIQEWSARGTTMSHPFGAFKTEYERWLTDLKALLPQKGPANRA